MGKLSKIFSDVKPLPAPEDSEVLVSIAYSPEFREAHDIFRAVLKKEEKTARALDLTLELIGLNSANYTVWYYRRQCLIALNSNLYDELQLTDTITRQNVKNYQVWFHRRWLVEKLDDPDTALDELSCCAELLESDGKNYNAWSHRIWVNDHFSMWDDEMPFANCAIIEWDDEMPFANLMIEKDLLNNSAWNHRMLILHKTGIWSFDTEVQNERRQKEIEFVLTSLQAYPGNEAAWNYLRGFFCDEKDSEFNTVEETSDPLKASQRALYPPAVGNPQWRWKTAQNTALEEYCKSFSAGQEGLRFAIQILALICVDAGMKKDALEHYSKLAEVDTIRRRYWRYLAEQLQH
eukprot:gene1055-735_t